MMVAALAVGPIFQRSMAAAPLDHPLEKPPGTFV